MTTMATQGIKKYLAVYALLVVITILQFVIGYRNIEGGQLVVRMMTFGVIEVILVVLFMMNLSSEKKTFFKFIAFFMLFVLATLNYGWTDSFRLLLFRITHTGPS